LIDHLISSSNCTRRDLYEYFEMFNVNDVS